MTISKTYIADDGTKFQAEEECLQYEKMLKTKEYLTTAAIYNEDGEPLPMVASNFAYAFYVVAKTKEAAVYMNNLFHNYIMPWFYSGDDKPCAGCWFFNGDAWVTAERVFKTADTLKKILEL